TFNGTTPPEQKVFLERYVAACKTLDYLKTLSKQFSSGQLNSNQQEILNKFQNIEIFKDFCEGKNEELHKLIPKFVQFISEKTRIQDGIVEINLVDLDD